MGDYYYKILGLEKGASLEEIKAAYKEYAKNFHPDKQGGSEFFKKRFQEIQEAYEYLTKNYNQPKPEILEFHVSKEEISDGEFIEVYWETKNAKNVIISIDRGKKFEHTNYENLGDFGKKKFKISNFDNELSICLVLWSFSEKKEDVVGDAIVVKKKVSDITKCTHVNRSYTFELVIPYQYEGFMNISKERAGVKLNGKWGLIDKNGNLLCPCKYDSLFFNEKEGLLSAELNGKSGYINQNGVEVIPFRYNKDDLGFMCEGLVSARKNNKWGFIDKNERCVIPFEYDDASIFSNGLAPVALQSGWFSNKIKYGYIDTTGAKVIPFKYDKAYEIDIFISPYYDIGVFSDGLAFVGKNNKGGYINSQGNIVVPFIYDAVSIVMSFIK